MKKYYPKFRRARFWSIIYPQWSYTFINVCKRSLWFFDDKSIFCKLRHAEGVFLFFLIISLTLHNLVTIHGCLPIKPWTIIHFLCIFLLAQFRCIRYTRATDWAMEDYIHFLMQLRLMKGIFHIFAAMTKHCLK